jgi:IclR family mhp operon transcriptional activator
LNSLVCWCTSFYYYRSVLWKDTASFVRLGNCHLCYYLPTKAGNGLRMSEAIEPVLRALHVLQAMNQRQLSRLRDLHQSTGLPKSTVHRLLATLIEAGYVQKDEDLGVYSLTSKILSLTHGFHDNSLLVEVAAPIAEAITRSVKWPVAIGTFDIDAMVVRYSTRSHSPLTLRKTTVNQRFPMMASAMGQAYLTFCSAQQRQQILTTLRNAEPDKAALVHDRHRLRSLFNKVRRCGHGLRVGERGESTHIALPIHQSKDVGGVIGISVFSSCFNETTRKEYSGLLKAEVENIENTLAAL